MDMYRDRVWTAATVFCLAVWGFGVWGVVMLWPMGS